MDKNKAVFAEILDGEINLIETKRAMDNFNINRQKYIDMRQGDYLADLYKRAAASNLLDEDFAKSMLEMDLRKIDTLKKKDEQDLLKQEMAETALAEKKFFNENRDLLANPTITSDEEFRKKIKDRTLPLDVQQRKRIEADREWWKEKLEVDTFEIANQKAHEIRQGILDGTIRDFNALDEKAENMFDEYDPQYTSLMDMLRKQTKPNPKTDWDEYMKLENIIMNYHLKDIAALGKDEISGEYPRDAIEQKIQDAYKKNIADEDIRELWNRLDAKLPLSVMINLQQNIIANRQKQERKWAWWTLSFGKYRFAEPEQKEAARINQALFNKVVSDIAAGKEPSLKEIYTKSQELNIPFTSTAKFQSAPIMELDKEWDDLNAIQKELIWQSWQMAEKENVSPEEFYKEWQRLK